MPQTEREQRITLRVQDLTLPLRVPAHQEAHYRRGAEDLNLTLGLYRQRYPLPKIEGDNLYLAMAAIDVAQRCQRWRQEAQTRDMLERLEALSSQADRLYREHQTLLEGLMRSEVYADEVAQSV